MALGGDIGSTIGNIVGGIAGQQAGSGARGDSNNLNNIAYQIMQEISQAPDISKPLILEKYRQAGILTPQMEQAISAGPSALEKVNTDQQSLDAQRQALQQLQQRSTQGLTASDRAALAEAQKSAEADINSKQQQILQQAAMRGQAGQSNNLAAQLLAAQSGANRQATNANQVAQMAAQQALQATAQTGQLGGQINQQQFGEAAQKAAAADQMNRFNIQNQIGTQQRNVASSNQAQAGNLANLQSLNNANVSSQNQELNNQLQREAQQYGLNVNTAKAKSGAASGNAAYQLGVGNQQAQNAYNTYAGLGKTVGGIGDYAMLWQGGLSGAAGMNQGGPVDYRNGGEVPGKAQVPGDHPRNDTVHAMLSPQEIVVPRSLAESKLGKELLKLIHAHNSVKNRLNEKD